MRIVADFEGAFKISFLPFFDDSGVPLRRISLLIFNTYRGKQGAKCAMRKRFYDVGQRIMGIFTSFIYLFFQKLST